MSALSRVMLGPVLILITSWVLPLYSLLRFAMQLSFKRSLSAVYAFAIGLAVHTIAIFAWVLIRRSSLRLVEVFVLLASDTIMLALMLFVNGSGLRW